MLIVPNRSVATLLSTRTPTTGWCASSKRKWLASKTCCMRRVWETSSRVSVHTGKRLSQLLRANIWAHKIWGGVYFLTVNLRLTLECGCVSHSFFLSSVLSACPFTSPVITGLKCVYAVTLAGLRFATKNNLASSWLFSFTAPEHEVIVRHD